MIDAFGLQDHRSNIELQRYEGAHANLACAWSALLVKVTVCARSVPRQKPTLSIGKHDHTSCAHVCSIEEVETVLKVMYSNLRRVVGLVKSIRAWMMGRHFLNH